MCVCLRCVFMFMMCRYVIMCIYVYDVSVCYNVWVYLWCVFIFVMCRSCYNVWVSLWCVFMFVMCRSCYNVWVCLWCVFMFMMCRCVYNVSLPNVICLGKSYNITGLNRPLGLQKVEPSRILRQSAPECGNVVSRTHLPPVPSRKNPWYLFTLESESTPEP